MVGYDDERLWLVSGHGVLAVLTTAVLKWQNHLYSSRVWTGIKIRNHLYVSSEKGRLLRFGFGKPQPECDYPNPYFNNETKLAELSNGNILLFMTGMHRLFFS